MYCTQCGEKVNTKGKYCPHCGYKFERRPIVNFEFLKKCYVKIIKPHREKIVKYGPMASGITAAALSMIFIIIPAYGRLMYDKGLEYIEKSRYNEAVLAISQASVAGVSNRDINSFMGKAYINLNEYEKAKKVLQGSNRDSTPTQLKLLADIWKYEKEYQMYESVLKELIQISPNDSYAYLELSRYYREEGFYDNAVSILEKLLKRQKNSEAAAEIYNIYIESYVKNTSAKKASVVQDEAMKTFSMKEIHNLDINTYTAMSLSPNGKLIALKSVKDNRDYVELYSYENSVFKYHSSFKIPAGYKVSSEEITWANDSSMLAFYNGKNSGTGEYLYDSNIYIYDLNEEHLYNISDPGEDYVYYIGENGAFIIDSLPCFSDDLQTLYFSRSSTKGNWLCAIDLDNKAFTKLYEPADGGFIDYKILEKNGTLFFSVRGLENNILWGIYTYNELDGARKLKFDYDDRYYFLALESISPDGRYIMYHISIANQNNSVYIGIIDLETMKPVLAYPQEIDSIDTKMYALNKSTVFETERVFITRNATFSLDSKSLYVAEESLDAYGKSIRRFNLDTGSGDFVYLSFDNENASLFCVSAFAQISQNEYLIYDNGLKILTKKVSEF